jgi:hypothetical protein
MLREAYNDLFLLLLPIFTAKTWNETVNKHFRNVAKFRRTENTATNQTVMKYVENFKFMWPCIVTWRSCGRASWHDVHVAVHRDKSLQWNQLDALISQIYFGMKFYMFRTVPLSIIRSFSLYTQQWYMSYRFADGLRAGSDGTVVPSWSCSQAVWLWGASSPLCLFSTKS